ncbi:TonB-dependent receptor [Polaribacter sp. R2A056_3_33]|uniref:TonB-dependent receptor n=1 Tax=unclassified Polaribacter TaxID=196858 RepID=UPI001C500001|nr:MULTISPECIES: TonB-dependent receptor [unclassified Polaribacter]QXP63048.1 TonB-dependent receptor [Polaribacter sp. HaHaR_3_91]QXP71077.1 TonB-dependent receptor [Polaribacter sp. R2A056_3_33]
MKNILTIIIVVLMSSFTFSQENVIKGKVTDESNTPLPGVSIIVNGTTNGTVSDMEGEYIIEVKKVNAVMTFSYLGYKTKEIAIADKKQINVQMEVDAQSLTEIVITGIRASNISEVRAKREAAIVIEAITPEDIGNFSDTNAADALQRVAGVQIERDVDGVSGDRVSIRGIGPQFVGVTMNGRTPISAGNEGKSDFRKFNLNVIPTEIISGARIHKTTQAKEVSTNLGGTVDFQTIRPLEAKYRKKNYFASVNVRGASNSTIEDLDFGQRFSGVYGTKINEKLGVALSIIYADEDNIKDEASLRGITQGINLTDENGTEYSDVIVGRTINNSLLRKNEVRFATSAAIQWRPIKEIDMVLDYTRTTVEANSDRQQFQIGLGSTGGTQLLGGSHIFNEGDLDFNGNILTYISPSSEDNVRTTITNANQFYDNHSTNNIVGLNTTYKPINKLKIISDVSYSDLNYFQNLTQITHRVQGRNGGYDQTSLDVDLRGDTPDYGLPVEAFDPASFDLNRVSRRLIRTKGYNYAAKVDFEYELKKKSKISFGSRYSVTDFEARQTTSSHTDSDQLSGLYGGIVADLNSSGAYTDLLGEITGVGFNEGNVAGLENGWVKVPGQAVLDLMPGYSDVDGGSIFDFDVDLKDVKAEENNLGFDARRSYGANEASTDFYTQMDIKTALLKLPVSLNFGVRAVRTQNKSRGFSGVAFEDADTGDDLDEFSIENFYYEVETSRWDVLPSFNANFTLQKRTKLRFSAYRGVSRPKFVDLIPNNEITFLSNIAPEDAADLANSGLRGTIVSGNPDLKPYTAWMYDTTLEFYTNNGGAFIFSAFYKDLKNYIVKAVTPDQTYPGEELLGIALPDGTGGTDDLTGLLFDITKPVNITDGQIYGFEVGLNQHLSFLPGFAKDFGVKANYSYVESEFDGDLGEQADGFPGTAKHNANGTLYYERSGFSVRFTAAYRGDYLSNLGAIGGNTRADEPHYTEGNTTLGITVRKNLLNKKLQLSAGVSNLTGEDIRRFQGGDTRNFSAYYARNPIWKLTMRYKF